MTYLSDDGPWVFLVLTCILGGGAAFLAGRGLAGSWKPFWRIFFYMVLLAAAVRFFHYALFDGTLTSLSSIDEPAGNQRPLATYSFTRA